MNEADSMGSQARAKPNVFPGELQVNCPIPMPAFAIPQHFKKPADTRSFRQVQNSAWVPLNEQQLNSLGIERYLDPLSLRLSVTSHRPMWVRGSGVVLSHADEGGACLVVFMKMTQRCEFHVGGDLLEVFSGNVVLFNDRQSHCLVTNGSWELVSMNVTARYDAELEAVNRTLAIFESAVVEKRLFARGKR